MSGKKLVKKRINFKFWDKYLLWIFGAVSGGGFVLAVGLGLVIWYADRPWPMVKLVGKPVGNLTAAQIEEGITNMPFEYSSLKLATEEKEWQIKISEFNYQIDLDKTVNNAINWGKNWTDWKELLVNIFVGVDLPILYSVDETAMNNRLDEIVADVFVPSIKPEVIVNDGTDVIVSGGTLGRKVDIDNLEKLLRERLGRMSNELVNVPVEVNDLRISNDEQERLRMRAIELLEKKLIVKGDDREFIWSGDEIIRLLDAKDKFDEIKLRNSLDRIALQTDLEPKNATFIFNEETKRVEEFQPEVIGKKLVIENGLNIVKEKLIWLENEATMSAEVQLSYQEFLPQIKTGDINDLGIRELLGRGTSTYKGSIAGRVFNVALGAERINGVLVPPGGVFSFNDNVGEVSSATGYKRAYVIRSGATVLDDGGGMCQVSTTVFRAALNAGLPIKERKAHSYRVGYYEQDSKAGLDATVYAPSVDLEFTNDTPAHILIQTLVDESVPRLTVEIFGTADGRTVELSTPRVWDVVAPPEDLYVDDPTLAPGEVKQIEFKAWGAKAAFDWKVMRDGEILQDHTFYSSYRPWGAVFLRGMGNL